MVEIISCNFDNLVADWIYRREWMVDKAKYKGR